MGMIRKRATHAALALGMVLVLGACGGSDDPAPETPPTPEPPAEATTLKFGVLPDTQGGDSGVSLHTMRAALDLFREEGVSVVLAIGDIVENGRPEEYEAWRGLAEEYRDDLTILPIMGNHDIKGTDQDWYDTVESFVPADAEHMPGAWMKNYAWIKDNVLFINISYGLFERSYDFVEAMVLKHHGKVDHIVLQTHNSFAGNRYGLVRENIIDGSHAILNDVKFREDYDKYRTLFTKYDVIYLAGHEHHYSRSVITDDSSLPFLQIITGNAAYKGYESRFGEHEQIQKMVMLKVQADATGSVDLTAPIFSVTGPVVDYRAYYVRHSVQNNEDGPGELATPDWKLFDRFVRTTARCDKVVFASSIPAEMEPSGIHDSSYRTSNCTSPNGDVARLLDGRNNLFNRYDTRTRAMGATPGISFAASNTEMLAMMYRYIFIAHESYRPNANNSQRARIVNAGTEDEEVEVRATTIDLKKLVSLNWLEKTGATLSDRLIVSGINAQDGVYIDPYGNPKDIAADAGLPGSYGDGSETGKAPVVLPAYATRSWELRDDKRGDPYVLSFKLPAGVSAESAALARQDADGAWQPLVASSCLSGAAYAGAYLDTLPADVDAGCAAGVVGGYDAGNDTFWARVDQDGVFAVVARNE